MDEITYPEPFNAGFLKVSDLHTIYYEESGNPQGIPLLRIHGGPGSHSKPKHRSYFDSQKFRIILYDQRGCGQSTPSGKLNENTTQELVKDIDKLRQHLNIEKWVIVGPSWGSTLALLYSQSYPQHVQHLIVQGVFTGRKSEIDWMLGQGAEQLFPDLYNQMLKSANLDSTQPLAHQILNNLKSSNTELQKQTAKSVSQWEYSISTLYPEDTSTEAEPPTSQSEIAANKIAYHYLANNCFLPDDYILNNSYKLQNTSLTIIQGRYDMVCPFTTAWELFQKCPHATFIPVVAGHYGNEPALRETFTQALNQF